MCRHVCFIQVADTYHLKPVLESTTFVLKVTTLIIADADAKLNTKSNPNSNPNVCHLSQQSIQPMQSTQILYKVHPPSNAYVEATNSDQSKRQDNACRSILQRRNRGLSSNTCHIHFTPPQHCHEAIHSKASCILNAVPRPVPTWDRMMHPISMLYQSVKHSLGYREALKHCVTV